MKDGDAFNSFMSNEVSARLYDEEVKDEFETYLQDLANTGFARDSLEEILAAEISEEPSWAVGEAMAEAFGVLIRDTQPNELDLQARGRTMAGKLQYPTTCDLSAIYLPCAIGDLPYRILGGKP